MATTTSTASGAGFSRGMTLGALAPAGFASLGAGAIHAAAIGLHAEHRQAAVAFAVLAFAQIVWGALALTGGGRLLAAAGAALNAGAVGGWVVAKTSGISAIDGLETAEGIQWPDGLAALLAAIAVVAALRHLVAGREAGPVSPRFLSMAGAVVAVMALAGLVTAGDHSHAGGHGDSGGGGAAAAHDHGDESDDAGSGGGHQHGTAVVPPKTYDPTKPIDLGGVEGVTPEEQARAENMIAITLDRLPHYADHTTAEAEGFHSIGDGFTGHEHFINWNYINDEHVLNPDYPEALVYETDDQGGKKLVSAMFMLSQGTTLDDVPELGGDLTQWHVHDDLCFSDDPVAPRVVGITSVGGDCPPPTKKLEPVPMIHVWIVPHPCGPFAALEGVGAGQIPEGEERLCDHAHGA